MRLGPFDVDLGVVESALRGEQLAQVIMIPELFSGPVEGGGDPKGCLEVVGSLFCFVVAAVYVAKKAVTSAGPKFFIFAWEEVDCSGRGGFRGVELAVTP